MPVRNANSSKGSVYYARQGKPIAVRIAVACNRIRRRDASKRIQHMDAHHIAAVINRLYARENFRDTGVNGAVGVADKTKPLSRHIQSFLLIQILSIQYTFHIVSWR